MKFSVCIFAAFASISFVACNVHEQNSGSVSKTGLYVEASRNETFSICPPDKKTEGTWISEHSVALNEKNCLSVQSPDLAGTFRVLFMENSGLTDTIQVLVEQSYIQMGDYSHMIFVVDTAEINAGRLDHPPTIYAVEPGSYENMSYTQPLIVDKTKFTMGDAQHYFKVGNIETVAYLSSYAAYVEASDIVEHINKRRQKPYIGEKLDGSRLPLVNHEEFVWLLANERSKKEGLDTAYYKNASGSIELDTSASGYRVPFQDEWFFLMRAGTSTKYFWGDDDDPSVVSRYVWIPTRDDDDKLMPVAQRLPNGFGLYDMVGIAKEFCDTSFESFFTCKMLLRNNYKSFRLLRKTPKLHKLEKF